MCVCPLLSRYKMSRLAAGLLRLRVEVLAI